MLDLWSRHDLAAFAGYSWSPFSYWAPQITQNF